MKYECKNSGSTNYNGKRIRYTKGKDDYPEGALDHVGSCRMITQSTKTVVQSSEKRDKPIDGTKAEIKKWLDDNGVEYKSSALKDELLDTLKNA